MPDTFEETVRKLGLCFFPGKQAIEGEATNRITAKDTTKFAGSVQLDNDLEESYPNDNRWDYVVAYDWGNNQSLYYIEIHPASSTSQVNKIMAKKKWLDSWLMGDGNSLKIYSQNLKVGYYWITTGKVSPLDSPARIKMAKKGIIGPLSRLVIK